MTGTAARVRLWPGAIAVVLLVTAVLLVLPNDDPWLRTDRRATTWGEVVTVPVGGESWEFRPYRIDAHEPGEVCVAHRTSGSGGSWCFVAGWAVETREYRVGDNAVLLGVTVPEAATVRVPAQQSGGEAVLAPDALDDLGVGFFTLVLDEDTQDATVGNRISAYASDGTKLGNEHDRTVDGDFGPWDGVLDGNPVPPVPGSRADRMLSQP